MSFLRIPFVQHDQFYKTFTRRGDINFPGDQRNSNQTYGEYPIKPTYAMDDKKIEIKNINTVTMSTTLSNLLPEQIAENFTEISKHRAPTRPDDISVTEVTKG